LQLVQLLLKLLVLLLLVMLVLKLTLLLASEWAMRARKSRATRRLLAAMPAA
jgi:hypothetical protein